MPTDPAVVADPAPWEPAFLGALQGLTEFLPVSSSGHLVLFQQFLPVAGDAVLFDLVLHLGTLLPVVWFYRKDVGELITAPVVGEGALLDRDGVRMLLFLVLASIPTAIIGLAFEDVFESPFSTPAVLALTFAITGCLLFATRFAPVGDIKLGGMRWWHAVLLGFAQGMAITPGISRSGTTIAVALFMGLEREHAARFSFLMSVPAILGAVLLKLRDVTADAIDPMSLGIGFATALVTGYGALVLLVGLVKRGGFPWFAPYCWLAAGFSLLLALGVFA